MWTSYCRWMNTELFTMSLTASGPQVVIGFDGKMEIFIQNQMSRFMSLFSKLDPCWEPAASFSWFSLLDKNLRDVSAVSLAHFLQHIILMYLLCRVQRNQKHNQKEEFSFFFCHFMDECRFWVINDLPVNWLFYVYATLENSNKKIPVTTSKLTSSNLLFWDL